jgi:hypothetical protein
MAAVFYQAIRVTEITFPASEDEYYDSASRYKKSTFWRFKGKNPVTNREETFSCKLALDLFKQCHFITLSFTGTPDTKYKSVAIADETIKIHRKTLTTDLLVLAIQQCYEIPTLQETRSIMFSKFAELTDSTPEALAEAQRIRNSLETSTVLPDLIYSHSYLTTAVLFAGYYSMENMEQLALSLLPAVTYLTSEQKQAVYYTLQKKPENFFFAITCPAGLEPLKFKALDKVIATLQCTMSDSMKKSIQLYSVVMDQMSTSGTTMMSENRIMAVGKPLFNNDEESVKIVANLVSSGVLHAELLGIPENLSNTATYYMDGLLVHQENQILPIISKLCRVDLDWLCPIPVLKFLSQSTSLSKIVNKSQRHALFLMLTEGLCVISGGGGVGKTHTLMIAAHILHIVCPHQQIMIATTTGKASVNMGLRYKAMVQLPAVKQLEKELTAFIASGFEEEGGPSSSLLSEKTSFPEYQDILEEEEYHSKLFAKTKSPNLKLLQDSNRKEEGDGDDDIESREIKIWKSILTEAQCQQDTTVVPKVADPANPTKDELHAISKWAEFFTIHEDVMHPETLSKGRALLARFKEQHKGLISWYATHPRTHSNAVASDGNSSTMVGGIAVNEKVLPDQIAIAIEKASGPDVQVKHRKMLAVKRQGVKEMDGSFQTLQENLHVSTIQNIIHLNRHGMQQMGFGQRTPVRLIIDEQLLDIGKFLELANIFSRLYSLSLVGDENQLPPIGIGSLFHVLLSIRQRDIPYPVQPHKGLPDAAFYKSRVFTMLNQNQRVDKDSLEIIDALNCILDCKSPYDNKKGGIVTPKDPVQFYPALTEMDWDKQIEMAFKRHKNTIDETDFITPTRELARRINNIGKKVMCPHLPISTENQLGPGVCFGIFQNFRASDGSYFTNGSKKTVHSIYKVTEIKEPFVPMDMKKRKAMESQGTSKKKQKTYKATAVPFIDMNLFIERESYYLLLKDGIVLPMKDVPLYGLDYGWSVNAHRKQGDESNYVIVANPIKTPSVKYPLGGRMIYTEASRGKKMVGFLCPESLEFHLQKGFALQSHSRLTQKIRLPNECHIQLPRYFAYL